MLKRFMIAIALIGILVSSAAEAAAAGGIRRIRNRGGNGNNAANDYDGGSGDSVKSIKPEDAEKSKDGKGPVFLYIYDADADDNVFAKHLESLLSNKEIDQMLENLRRLRLRLMEAIRMDGLKSGASVLKKVPRYCSLLQTNLRLSSSINSLGEKA